MLGTLSNLSIICQSNCHFGLTISSEPNDPDSNPLKALNEGNVTFCLFVLRVQIFIYICFLFTLIQQKGWGIKPVPNLVNCL